MKTKILLLALALGAAPCFSQAQDGNPPPINQPPRAGGRGGPGGPGGFHVLPPPVMEELNLTEAQQKEMAALETELKGKLEKILKPDQLEVLKQFVGAGRRGGLGGQGGPGQGGPAGGFGGPRGQGGEGQFPPPDQNGPGRGPGPGIPGGPGQGGPGQGGRGQGGPGGQRAVNPLVAALDLNGDGIIDASEIAQASESLKKLDKNGDGKITPEEYRPARGGQGPGNGGPGAGGRRGQGGPGGPGGPDGQGGPGGPGGQRGPGGENRPQRPPLDQ